MMIHEGLTPIPMGKSDFPRYSDRRPLVTSDGAWTRGVRSVELVKESMLLSLVFGMLSPRVDIRDTYTLGKFLEQFFYD